MSEYYTNFPVAAGHPYSSCAAAPMPAPAPAPKKRNGLRLIAVGTLAVAIAAGTASWSATRVGVAVEQHDQCPAERWLVQWLERLGSGSFGSGSTRRVVDSSGRRPSRRQCLDQRPVGRLTSHPGLVDINTD